MKLSLLFCLVAFATFAVAAPTGGELDTTKVVVAEQDLTNNVEEFVVVVNRIEDEIDSTGQITGERKIAVALVFDVKDDGTVTVNGKPAAYGVSTIKVAAKVTNSALSQVFQPINDVSVLVFVGAEKATDANGNVVHRVIIQERIIEIEGNKVWQADIREQMIDLHTNGQVVKHAVVQVGEMRGILSQPGPMSVSDDKHEDDDDDDDHEEKKEHHPHGEHKHEHKPDHKNKGKHCDQHSGKHHGHHREHHQHMKEQLANTFDNFKTTLQSFKDTALTWYHNQLFIVRVLIAFLLGMFVGLLCVSLLSCVMSCFGVKCRACKASNYDSNLRTFAAEYTAIPMEDKEEKKKEQEA